MPWPTLGIGRDDVLATEVSAKISLTCGAAQSFTIYTFLLARLLSRTLPDYLTDVLGEAHFQLFRMLIASTADPSNHVCSTTWQALDTIPAQRTITMNFSTATAFSLSERQFGLFPEPPLIWESLLRSWNRYAPETLHMEKQAIREVSCNQITVTACTIRTGCLHFPASIQKGFTGQCTYQLLAPEPLVALLTTLAAFAQFSGIGYKTTMGMGQVQVIFGEPLSG